MVSVPLAGAHDQEQDRPRSLASQNEVAPASMVSARWPVRAWIEAITIVVLAATLVRTWCAQAFTVDGPSMAPMLLASHADVVCPNCGWSFAAGNEGALSDGRRAICPNCGSADARFTAGEAAPGDTVLVDKTAFQLRNPRRWEVASLRAPESAATVCVKRVVGLPGEEISIKDGDLYASGLIVRKSLAEQRALSVIVHDDGFRPVADDMARCWEGSANWSVTKDGYSFDAAHEDSPRRRGGTEFEVGEGIAPARPVASGQDFFSSLPTDWLTYHHRRLNTAGEVDESPVQDIYSYNQTTPIRELHVVRDLALSFLLEARGAGAFFLKASDGEHEFFGRISADGDVLVYANDELVATRKLPQPLIGAPRRIEFSLIDRCCLLAVDGQVVAESLFDPPAIDAPATTRPFAIASDRLAVAIRELRITRDVFYGNHAEGADLGPVRLGPGEYFVVSDNALRGFDSRDEDFGPGVPFKLFVGKPLAAITWRRPPQWPWSAIQVPALRQIRYIR